MGTGTRPASRTSSKSFFGTGISSGTGFGSGPCPTDPAHYPSFIQPSINPTQSCDIYGPLCQTGSIAVGVRASQGVNTTTTVPCSCYLTAQSLTVNPTAAAWQTGFGRSPQCNTFLRIAYTPSAAIAAPIFSSCPMGHYPGAPNLNSLGMSSLNK